MSFLTCCQLLCALSSLTRLVVGTLSVLLWPRRLVRAASNDPGRPSVACRAVAPWGPHRLSDGRYFEINALIKFKLKLLI